MYRYLILFMLLVPKQALSSQVVVARERAHSGRTLSCITQNFDLGSVTPEEMEKFDKMQTAQRELINSFFKAAKTGEGLEPFLSLKNFDFNVKNECDGGKTALMYVAELGHTELADKLMKKNAWAFSIKDYAGKCAYDHAQGHAEVRKLMGTMQFRDLCRRNSIEKVMTDVCTVMYMGVTIIGPNDENEQKS